jgi:enoyl-CoA hydratase/carnithine racemase
MEAKPVGLMETVPAKGESLREAKKIAERKLLRGPTAVAKAKEGHQHGNQPGSGRRTAFSEKRKPGFTDGWCRLFVSET